MGRSMGELGGPGSDVGGDKVEGDTVDVEAQEAKDLEGLKDGEGI